VRTTLQYIFLVWESVPLPFCSSNDTYLKLCDLNDYIKTWLRYHECATNMQIRTASQKSAVKQEDPV